MKLKRCERGHYYDTKHHSRCPSCGVSGLGVTAVQNAPQTSAPSATTAVAQAIPATQVRGQTPAPSAAAPEAIGTTVAMVRKITGIDPVVAWLVCVSGPDKGRDYRIRSERNSIGRGTDMNICINGDESISRENHAFISFNPRKGSFRIAPGDGRGMTYLNGEEVDIPHALEAYDLIEMGQSQLLFIPLCGERFNWEGEGE